MSVLSLRSKNCLHRPAIRQLSARAAWLFGDCYGSLCRNRCRTQVDPALKDAWELPERDELSTKSEHPELSTQSHTIGRWGSTLRCSACAHHAESGDRDERV